MMQKRRQRITEMFDNLVDGNLLAGQHGLIFCLSVLLLCSSIGFVFYLCGISESNIITVYVVGVLTISILTNESIYWVGSSIVAVLLFNCLYAEPRFTLLYYDPQHTIAMLLLLLAAVSVGLLAQQFRRKMEEQSEMDRKADREVLRVNLLRSIGHDLRTPLTGISGDAEILISRGEQMSEDLRLSLYENIYDNSEWLIDMVENMLFVTRIDKESGSLPINKQPELLSELVDESLRHISKKSSQHTINCDCIEDMLMVNVDAHMIMQVITNIVNNAIKHTQVGSTINITTRRQDNQAVLEVADDGPGVSGDSDRVFEMFYSTGGTENGERRGMGLGLSLGKIIIEVHGGQIYYRPNQPKGAIFGFTLPIERM